MGFADERGLKNGEGLGISQSPKGGFEVKKIMLGGGREGGSF